MTEDDAAKLRAAWRSKRRKRIPVIDGDMKFCAADALDPARQRQKSLYTEKVLREYFANVQG